MSTEPQALFPDVQQPQGDDRHGWPRPFFAFLERQRPPGPLFTDRVWRSPLRGPWLTSVFGFVLLLGLPIVIVTGLLSYVAYQPQFAGNGHPGNTHGLRLPYFAWPTHPVWLYRLNQSLHVSFGLALIPLVLAKLWSVIPKLFAWPPARSVAQLLERLSLALLVGSILFELATGVLDIEYDYQVFGFNFYTAHYYGAWVFIAAFLLHVGLKFSTMRAALKTRRVRDELRVPLAQTVPEPTDEYGLVATHPAAATLSRRGLLALVGGGSLLLTAVTVGETVGWRATAVLSARGRSYGGGPTDFQINKTARAAGITAKVTGADWRLTVVGQRTVVLSRAQLLAMEQYTVRLPIACVEGWSTVQTWTGVRLRDLVALTGARGLAHGTVISLQQGGAFSKAVLNPGQLGDPDSLLALKVNHTDLSPDHGFPARVIVPAAPGVHCTKWVHRIELEEA